MVMIFSLSDHLRAFPHAKVQPTGFGRVSGHGVWHFPDEPSGEVAGSLAVPLTYRFVLYGSDASTTIQSN
jgi:hypothetical protein